MELKTKQGLQTLLRAHAFLAGKELTAAVGDLKPHVEALDAIIVKLEAFATEQAALDLARRSAATAGMLSELSRGRDLVRLLDLMLAPRLAAQPDPLAEWRSIARFLRGATVSAEKEVPPTTGTIGTIGSTPAGNTVPSVPATTTPTAAAA